MGSDRERELSPTEKPIRKIWELSPINVKRNHDRTGRIKVFREARHAAQTWVIEELRNSANHLLMGESFRPGDENTIRELFQKIADNFVGNGLKWRHNFLLTELNRGSRDLVLQWPRQKYPFIVRLGLRGSPINTRTFPMIRKFNLLRKAFIAHIKQDHAAYKNIDRQPDPEKGDQGEVLHHKGLVLLSMVLFGGAGSSARLRGIASNAMQRMEIYRDLLWVDWQINPENPGSNWTRWISDPLSALLLSVSYDGGMKTLVPNLGTKSRSVEYAMWKAINCFLAKIDLPESMRPTSLGMLMSWSKAWHYRHLPPFVAAYMTGELQSVSLPPHAWRRMLERIPVKHIQDPDKVRDEPIRTQQKALSAMTSEDGRYADADLVITHLRTILQGQPYNESLSNKQDTTEDDSKKNTKEKHSMRRHLASLRKHNNLTPLCQLLIDWVSARIDHHSQYNSSTSVVYGQLAAIDRLMLGEIGIANPLEFTNEQFEFIYQRVIE